MDATNHNQVMGEITELKISMTRLTTQFGHMAEILSDMKEAVEKLTPRNDSAAMERRIDHMERQMAELTAIVQRAKGMWIAVNALWAIAFGIFEIWRSFR